MRSLQLLVAAVFGCALSVSGQQPPPAQAQPIAGTLILAVMQGAEAVNDTTKPSVAVPVVEVRDSNDQPIAGAQVIFTLPADGPGGTFLAGGITFNTRTNVQGQASAPYSPNDKTGAFTIQVVANSANRVGQVSIGQTNFAGIPVDGSKKGWKSKKWWIIGGVAAAVGVTLAVVLTRGSSPEPVSSPSIIIITPGPPVFGGP